MQHRLGAFAAPVLAAACVALALAPAPTVAQDVYIGQIVIVGENFCPRGTASAEGQLLAIASNTALFSLYGTFYGGDGRTTFGLPDLRGRRAMGQGTGPGLTPRSEGQRGGAETVTLTERELPAHSHAVNATNADGDQPGPGGKILAAAPPNGAGSETIYSDQPANRAMSDAMIERTGAAAPIDLKSPFVALRYCVALQGVFPSRN